MISSDNKPQGSRQITISSNEKGSTHLVLKLKSQESKLEQQKEILQSKIDQSVNTFSQSTLGQSMLQSKTTNDFSDYEFESLSSSEEIENEETVLQYEDAQEELAVVQEELDIVKENQKIVHNQEEEREEISNLELLGGHIVDIVKAEGTTFLNTLVTIGTGATAIYTGGAIMGAVGGAMLLVAGNEGLKMAYRYIQKTGANDHLLMIGKALEKIEENNTISRKSIDRAQKSQDEALKKLGELSVDLDELEEQLDTTIGEQNENIQEAIKKLTLCKAALVQQNFDLGNAISLLKQSMDVGKNQSEKMQALLSAEYKIENKEDLEEVVIHLKQAINEIKSSSETAYGLQSKAMDFLMKAMDEKSELISLHHDLTSAFTKINLLNLKLAEAEEKITEAKDKTKELKKEVAKTKDELKLQKELREEEQNEIQTAKQHLDLEMKQEHFGETSTLYGVGGALGAGGALGFALAGPVGAVGLGAAAFVGVGTCAVRAVHRARLVMRTNALKKKKMELAKAQNELQGSKFQKNGTVTVSAEYGYSTGSYFGTYTLKSLYNVSSSIAKYTTGKDMGEYKSTHAGKVKCVIGNIPFIFDFDKTTGPSLIGTFVPSYMDLSNSAAIDQAYEDYKTYGAISQIDQHDFSEILLDELKKENITPQMILELLDLLSEVKIANEVVVMISKDSPLMKTLRDRCKELITS